MRLWSSVAFGIFLSTSLCFAEDKCEGISREEMQKVGNLSPEYVEAHKMKEWIELFAPNALIEDPVGSGEHINFPGKHLTAKQKNKSLESFYKVFIQPNKVHFNLKKTIFNGCFMVRKVVIESVTQNGLELNVPANLIYEFTKLDGQVKVRTMKAYWHLDSMLIEVLKNGVDGVTLLGKFGNRVVRNLGMASLGYAKETFNFWMKVYKRKVLNFLQQYNSSDILEIQALAKVIPEIEMADGTIMKFADFDKRFGALKKVGNIITSGNFGTVWVETEKKETAFLRFAFRKSGKIQKIWFAVGS